MRTLTLLATLLLSALHPGAASGPQWGQFRGPNGSGIAEDAPYPTALSPQANLKWKAAVPYGQSSPVVADGRVYLTGTDAGKLITLCLDAATGRVLWRKQFQPAALREIYRGNDPASPTPAADEHGVVVFFPDAGLAAYAPGGEEIWTVPLGPFKNFYGMAASPIIADGMVILVCDQQSGSFLIALDRRTGQRKWRTERASATNGWATPMLFRPAAAPSQLIVLGTDRLDSYQPATGELRWWMPVGTLGSAGVPVAAGDTLYVSSRGSTEPWMRPFAAALADYDKNQDNRISQQELLADRLVGDHFGWIDTDGDGLIAAGEWDTARNIGIGEFGAFALKPGSLRGRLEPDRILWRFKKNIPYIPDPLYYDGVIYLVREGGILTTVDAATGKLLKEGRIPGAPGGYYASPVAADGKIYTASREGHIAILKAGGQWEPAGVTALGDEVHATPALSQGSVIVRTREAVYCFGASPAGK